MEQQKDVLDMLLVGEFFDITMLLCLVVFPAIVALPCMLLKLQVATVGLGFGPLVRYRFFSCC